MTFHGRYFSSGSVMKHILMKKSITYYITLLAIKVKGLKRTFSQSPVDYKKLRQEDVHAPGNTYLRKSHRINTFTERDTTLTEIKPIKESTALLLLIHGGAFVSGPAQHHWDAVKKIAEHTRHTVWLCNYPKAPEHNISLISENIDQVYRKALQQFDSKEITVLGDSVGGTLAIALTQRLIQKEITLPHQLILISPVVDATLSNPEINAVDKLDPMLSKKGVLSAKEMCAEHNDLHDVSISPINGTFERFPKTLLFLAQHDITYPDQQLLVKKLERSHIDHEIVYGEGMPHIWPLLPIMKEAKIAFNRILDVLNERERTPFGPLNRPIPTK